MILRTLRALLAGICCAALATGAGVLDLKNADGWWTYSLNGNVNVEYIWSSCQSATAAVDAGAYFSF